METFTFTSDNELKRLYRKFSFLWKEYNFKVTYFNSSYDMNFHRFILGLENSVCKLVFEKNSDSPERLFKEYIGKKSSPFAPPDQTYYAEDGWYPVSGLISLLTGIQHESDRGINQDLDITCQSMKLHIEDLLDLYRDTEAFEGKMEYYRNLHRCNQITIDSVKAERARLKELGLDWSLEAAIKNLKANKK